MKTVLTTGCSSGFGLETPVFPRSCLEGHRHDAHATRGRAAACRGYACVRPDVTDPESICPAVHTPRLIEILVNRAGFREASAAKVTPTGTVGEVLETNTFGTIAMTQAMVLQFPQRKAGAAVNATSSVNWNSLLLLFAYTASKVAVTAFTESMALELEPFDVPVRLVVPGGSPETRLSENARLQRHGFDHQAYADLVKRSTQSGGQVVFKRARGGRHGLHSASSHFAFLSREGPPSRSSALC